MSATFSHFEYLASELGAPTISDIFYGHVQLADESAEYRTVAELLVAVANPEVLSIGDIEFSDPFQPLAEEEIVRSMTRFKDLSLLEETIQRCSTYARQQGLDAICLTPAEQALVSVLEGHGFGLGQIDLDLAV